MEKILARMRSIYEKDFDGDPKDVDISTRLDELELDSLDQFEFLLTVEEVFDINVPENEYDSLRTVGDVARYVFDNANL